MLSKSLIQFSIDRQGYVPSFHCCTQCPQPCSGPLPTHTFTRDSWTLPGKSGSVSVGSLLLSPGSLFCLCPPRVYFPVLCKFWWLYGGINGDLLQEGLCQTQVCCTPSPCPCGSPLLTQTSTGDTQRQFWLSLCGVSGSWCTQGLFALSKGLWWGRGLVLNMILPSYHLAEASPLPLRFVNQSRMFVWPHLMARGVGG